MQKMARGVKEITIQMTPLAFGEILLYDQRLPAFYAGTFV